MCFPIVSKSLSVSLGTAVAAKVEPSAREHVPQLVPHLVPPSVIAKRPCRGELRSAQHPESDAAKTTPWPGATPFCPSFCGPKPLQATGVAPGHGALHVLLGFCRVALNTFCQDFLASFARMPWQSLPELSGKNCQESSL